MSKKPVIQIAAMTHSFKLSMFILQLGLVKKVY